MHRAKRLMRDIVGSIEGEYRRYHQKGRATIDQLDNEQLCTQASRDYLSIPPGGTTAYNANPTMEKG